MKLEKQELKPWIRKIAQDMFPQRGKYKYDHDEVEALLIAVGNKHSQEIQTAVQKEREKSNKKELTHLGIYHWLLGQNGDFPVKPEGSGTWYWRNELREKLISKGILKSITKDTKD